MRRRRVRPGHPRAEELDDETDGAEPTPVRVPGGDLRTIVGLNAVLDYAFTGHVVLLAQGVTFRCGPFLRLQPQKADAGGIEWRFIAESDCDQPIVGRPGRFPTFLQSVAFLGSRCELRLAGGETLRL